MEALAAVSNIMHNIPPLVHAVVFGWPDGVTVRSASSGQALLFSARSARADALFVALPGDTLKGARVPAHIKKRPPAALISVWYSMSRCGQGFSLWQLA